MSKREMMKRIRKNQKRETARHSTGWIEKQLRELSDYLEMGTDDGLREKCLCAIRWLIGYARRYDQGYMVPWYVSYC